MAKIATKAKPKIIRDKYRLLVVSTATDTEQVYDGSYTGKTVIRNRAICSTVVEFPTEAEAYEAISAIEEHEKHMAYHHKTQFRKLWKD